MKDYKEKKKEWRNVEINREEEGEEERKER